eukprot:6205985-Pleurochrysis_carterae.AAC.3
MSSYDLGRARPCLCHIGTGRWRWMPLSPAGSAAAARPRSTQSPDILFIPYVSYYRRTSALLNLPSVCLQGDGICGYGRKSHRTPQGLDP